MKSAFTILLAVVLFIQKGIATSGTTSGPLATLAATCDNQMKVYFDGALQEQDSAMPNWPQTSTLNIPDGTKVVAIECLDVGVVGGILASTSDGRVTDGSWQCSKTKLDGWTMPGFTDNSGAFVSADQSRGSHGVAPWGIRPGIAADANWIWHSPTHSNPDSAYCRMELAGNPVEKCCAAKTVGDIAYSLVEEGQVPGRCLNGCIYKKDSDPAGGQTFCFASGHLPVECIPTGEPGVWTTAAPLPPILTSMTFKEGNETMKQSHAFHEDTGVLEMSVPAHGNYSEALFVIDKDDGVMLKTGGVCQISPHMNDEYSVMDHGKTMSENMARALQRMDGQEVDQKTYYMLKMRKERVGYTKRQKLNDAYNKACANEQITMSEDAMVSKESYEKFMKGEPIIMPKALPGPDDQTQRPSARAECVTTDESCSSGGPRACGRAWINPAFPEIGFSFHQVSAAAVCVACYIKKDDCWAPKQTCSCKFITNKNKLVYCFFKGNRPAICRWKKRQGWIQGRSVPGERMNEGEISQSLAFVEPTPPKVAEAFIVEVPEHEENGNTVQALTVVMHAACDDCGKAGQPGGWWHTSVHYGTLENNIMMKSAGKCEIFTLPLDWFPVDMASGMREIKDTIVPEDEERKFFVHLKRKSFTKTDEGKLHPNITTTCQGAIIEGVTQYEITEEEARNLIEKGWIPFDKASNGCLGKGSGTVSWQWPSTMVTDNEVNNKLMIHGIFIQTIEPDLDGCFDLEYDY